MRRRLCRPGPPRCRQPRRGRAWAGELQTLDHAQPPAAAPHTARSVLGFRLTEASDRILWLLPAAAPAGDGAGAVRAACPHPTAPRGGPRAWGASFPEMQGALGLGQAHRLPRGEVSCPIPAEQASLRSAQAYLSAAPHLPAAVSTPGSPGRAGAACSRRGACTGRPAGTGCGRLAGRGTSRAGGCERRPSRARLLCRVP